MLFMLPLTHPIGLHTMARHHGPKEAHLSAGVCHYLHAHHLLIHLSSLSAHMSTVHPLKAHC